MPTRYEILPISPRMTHTALYAAGPIQLGVEYRLLNEALIAEEYGDDARGKFGDDPPEELGDQANENGVSIHVFDDSGEREYPRFDCFEDFPHYHYIDPDAGRQTVHSDDATSLARVLPEVAAAVVRARKAGRPIPASPAAASRPEAS